MAVRPTIHELEALRAIIATRKTTLAARDLRISQPSVSRAIASLESRIGRKLFVREKGRLRPTPEALALEARAAVIFDLMDELGNPTAQPDGAGVVRIASPPTLAHEFLAPMLARYLAREPNVTVHVEIGKAVDCLAAVAETSADIGLVGMVPAHDGVRLEIFRTAYPHVVLPRGHRLASRPRLGPDDLARERLVVLTRRFALRTRIEAAFAAARIEPNVVAEATTNEFLVEMVRDRVGLAILNPFPIDLRADKRLAFRPFDIDMQLQTAIVVPAETSLTPAARKLANFLKAEQPKSPYSMATD